jgi:predicted alpha/beta hydrolase family esterase
VQNPVNRILIVPGLHNSGAGHWQTLWEKRFAHSCRIEMSDWSTANLDAWVNAIHSALDRFEPTHLVAHSFGTLAAACVAAERQTHLRGLFFAAPADPDKFGVRHLLPASPLSVSGILVGSLSDPWLSWSGARKLANQWDLKIECAGYAGHINVQSGHGDWQDGWQIFQRLLNPAEQPRLFQSVTLRNGESQSRITSGVQ